MSAEELLDCISVCLPVVNVFAIIVLVSESIKQEVRKCPSCLVNDSEYVIQFLVNRSPFCVCPLLLLGRRRGARGLILFIRVLVYGPFPHTNGKVILARY